MIQLSTGSLLQGEKYRIVKVLGQGGFGITYLAEHTLLGKQVAIKEFFYKDYCNRDQSTSHITVGNQSNTELVERFLKKFVKEAQTISQLHHPNIVEIYDIFSENNTAYYVMEYIEGTSLNEMVKNTGKLSEEKAYQYIQKVADALKCIHKNHINHLDVKPSNIMLRDRDNEIILIDFGTSKQYDVETNMASTTTTPVGISAGYAPIEQYRKGGVSSFSPESDIYALGATLYKLLTGITPPESIALEDEGLDGLETLSDKSRSVIQKCMRIRKSERPQSIEEFEELIKSDKKKDEEPVSIDNESTRIIPQEDTNGETSEESPLEYEDETPLNSSWKKYTIIGIFAAVCVFGFVYLKHNTNTSDTKIVNDSIKVENVDENAGSKVKDQPMKVENTDNNKKVDSKKSAKEEVKQETTPEDNSQILGAALRKGDFVVVQKLANQGYAPSYVPLAKYYLNNNEYAEADRYAKKGKAAGQSGAQAIINTLENLGYYD